MVQKTCLAVGTKLIPGCFVFMSVSELLFVLITFSALANGYRSENWENEELCGNTTPGQGSTSGEYVSPTDLNYWIKLLSCIIEANGGHIGLSHINLH